MTESLRHAESIFVDAAPNQVYSTVSDVTRTGEWSPVCQECWWDEEEGARLGAYFTGRNVTPERTWETRCEVIVAEPGRSFGWSVTDGNVYWIYTMRASGAGTELTESWEFTSKGQDFFVQKFGANADEEMERRHIAAVAGISATLVAVKSVIEQDLGSRS